MRHVSVIIPSFKRIEQTITTIGLLRASHRLGIDFEIEIIVSDSTPDTSLEKALKQKFNDMVIYTRPDKVGVAANKNQGARIAKHPILIFCDSDMEVESDTLLYTLNSLYTHTTAGMVGGQVIWKTGPKNGEIDRPRIEDRIEKINDTTYIEALYSRYVATYKDVFWMVGGYDETVFNMRGEGSDLSIRYWRSGFPLVYNELIRVHHVHDAPDSVALRIDHPEIGVFKDYLLLAYKYGMFDKEYPHFKKTVIQNFIHLGQKDYYDILVGIGNNLDAIKDAVTVLEKQSDKPLYDFKFLEVFSDTKTFQTCIAQAAVKLLPIRKSVFD